MRLYKQYYTMFLFYWTFLCSMSSYIHVIHGQNVAADKIAVMIQAVLSRSPQARQTNTVRKLNNTLRF